jgi:hypothetical protein
MIRRPLNERFAGKVLAGVKTTTIRDNPWPIGKPIMLFCWEDKPYRSKQVNIAPVVVEAVTEIDLSLCANGKFNYCYESTDFKLDRPVWHHEGFRSFGEMDAWFRAEMLPGQVYTKALMRFRLWTCADSDRYFDTHGKLP